MFWACRIGFIAAGAPLTAASNRGSMADGAGGVGDCGETEGCETAPETLVPGAVPLDVIVDCGSVPVATVGNGAAVS